MTRVSYICVVTGIILSLAIFASVDSLAADLTWEGHIVDEDADNASYMDGFETGNTSASSHQTIGNLDLDFGKN